jgi:hypothetical protein
MLAAISEADRCDGCDVVLISTEEQDAVSVIDKHLSGANKPKTTPVKQTWGDHNLTP